MAGLLLKRISEKERFARLTLNRPDKRNWCRRRR